MLLDRHQSADQWTKFHPHTALAPRVDNLDQDGSPAILPHLLLDSQFKIHCGAFRSIPQKCPNPVLDGPSHLGYSSQCTSTTIPPVRQVSSLALLLPHLPLSFSGSCDWPVGIQYCLQHNNRVRCQSQHSLRLGQEKTKARPVTTNSTYRKGIWHRGRFSH